MSSTDASFLSDIGANLYDDTPRLVYADWLEEHGDSERAEFIRVQCELEPIRDQYEIDRAAQLHVREEELLREHKHAWLRPGMEDWDGRRDDGASAEFRRGFVDTSLMPVRTFLALGAEARRLHPTIRRVVLYHVNSYGKRLASCSALTGLAELELACWYSDADARAIAASPPLAQLQVMELWLGGRGELTDARLCQIMAGAKTWPKLRQLILLNPNDENEQSKRRLIKLANKAAGRKIAVYHRGWPKRFPFAADFWEAFPGYLPEGRMAMAIEEYRTTPPSLCVLTFDRKGEQTKDVLNIPFPEELRAIPEHEVFKHRERLRQHLIETIGFRPGFIRIRDCRFPGDEDEFNRPYWEVYAMHGEEQFGIPDPDDEDSWSEYPCGYAGQLGRRRHACEYVFGWDRYADKRGQIHST